jgi:hypothetical protein
MQLWEYCEVAWTPKQVVIRVYSQRDTNMYQGVQMPGEWGALLAQLGADGWELTGVVPAQPANHTLYYFKRPMDNPSKVEWKEKRAQSNTTSDKATQSTTQTHEKLGS